MHGSRNLAFSVPVSPLAYHLIQHRECAAVTISHNTGERNVQFFELHIALSPIHSIKNVWFEEPCILSLSHADSHETGKRTWGLKNCTLPTCCIPPATRQERECTVILSACCILFHMRQRRECEVLWTLHSLPLVYHPPQNSLRRECAVLRTTHSLFASCTISHNTGERTFEHTDYRY